MRIATLALALLGAASLTAATPFPDVQIVALPDQQYAFEIGGAEVARYIAQGRAPKPYLFPLTGPAGHRLTSMLHPEDPHGHRHHRSVWVGHQDVNGHDFWAEDGGEHITMARVEAHGSTPDRAWIRLAHEWRAEDGAAILAEQRTWAVTRRDAGEYDVDLTLSFTPTGADVLFGKTPFGFLGVRVAGTMAVKAGGRVLNDSGATNEAGVHGNSARWVDYTGPVAPGVQNGVTLLDHPGNPGHPASFHVRDEGWMGASFTRNAPYRLSVGETLTLRYRLIVHGPDAGPQALEPHWERFAAE